MIALYLLAAHLVGDFVLQTRWQAERKFTDSTYRMIHVWTYALPFVPICALRSAQGVSEWRVLAFAVALVLLHFVTDSRRFRSTLGDWIVWRLAHHQKHVIACTEPCAFDVGDKIKMADTYATVVGLQPRPGGRAAYLIVRYDLPTNSWTPIPILIDQALHVCQLALLGGLFLS